MRFLVGLPLVVVLSFGPVAAQVEGDRVPGDPGSAGAGFAAGIGATAIHVYELRGSLTDELGGPALMAAGGTVGPTGYAFGANQGLSLAGSSIDPDDYTIELIFSLDEVGGTRKILDFKDLTSNDGLYDVGYRINFTPVVSGPNSAFAPGRIVHVLVTRDQASGQFSAFVNGTLHLSFTDTNDAAVFDGPNGIVQFFNDDFATGQSHASAGVAERIRIFDGPVSNQEAFDLWRSSGAIDRQTIGLLRNEPASFEGYNLFGVLTTGLMYLVDHRGRLINSWTSAYPTGNAIDLTPDGTVLRASRYYPEQEEQFGAGGRAGRIERFDWDGSLVWDFVYANADRRHHHDQVLLPNGNVLLLAWERKTRNQAIQAGRDPSLLPDDELWPETIIEVEPVGLTGGNVVWEWHLWDHLIQDFAANRDNFGVVGNHPELVDVNFVNGRNGSADWQHANAIDYDPVRDEIILSIPFFDEVWIIDHSTTTAEAAGHSGGNRGKGGDLLYRWGNPQAYRRGTDADRRLWFQHDAEIVEAGLPGAGNILVFNNGNGRPGGNFSSIDEIVPPRDGSGDYVIEPGEPFGPTGPAWSYSEDPPADRFAGFLSGAQRLPNGNTLVCDGPAGEFFEVQTDGTTVWRYVNPVSVGGPIPQGTPATNRTFRVERYAPDYPGLAGQDLTPGAPLETFVAPPPVPDGRSGSAPLMASRTDLAGSQLNVEWDAGSCPAADYQLLYGDLAGVPSYTLTGAECSIGTDGAHPWSDVPAADLYFLIVGVDPTGTYESSWGTASNGTERQGDAPSNQCTATNKSVAATCP